jgi:hypothetical protein
LFWVYYHNVNGVTHDDVTVAQDLHALAEYDVGCFCLSETNLDCNRPYVKTDYLSCQCKIWKHATTSFSWIDMESWTQEKIFMWNQQSKEAPHSQKQFIKDLITFINER